MTTYTFVTKDRDIFLNGRLTTDDEFFYVKDGANTFVVPRDNVIYYIF